ncbi:MAG: NADH-quinone oxidoreductase subunit J [Propionibacteriaceae bacterium]|jgi:NADH-quinone oxidoreductase subunit J|nr:NADH-quinone oxidoreductase subunit J [Propionibacteriaceae bacterium]
MFSTIIFWVAAVLAVTAALGTVVARKVVHSAICLCALMVGLGLLYATLDAPFLFVAQILVYTGSIVMLFLFTMMLIGIDTSESLGETIRGQRVASGIAIGALLVLLLTAIAGALIESPGDLTASNEHYGGNAQGLAMLIFTKYVFAFEAASALVLTAALAAMVLAHPEKHGAKTGQRELAAERMKLYADLGISPAPIAGPGVYARGNAIAYPALLPDGDVAPDSISPTLLQRGVVVTDAPALPDLVAEAAAEIAGKLPTPNSTPTPTYTPPFSSTSTPTFPPPPPLTLPPTPTPTQTTPNPNPNLNPDSPGGTR